MGDIAAAVLANAAEREKNLPSITVEKPIDLELDLGNMLAVDNNQMETTRLDDSESREEYLSELARDNTQLLINAFWKLPTERVEEVIVAKFPAPTTRLPREKILPVAKPETKWEKYAKEKGIVKTKKKDRMVWDEIVKEWVPQFGYKKKVVEDKKNWCIEIKETADPNLNPHEKQEEDKKEKKAKNELQRLRNLAKAKKIYLPTVGVVTPSMSSGKKTTANPADDLKQNAETVRFATASLGKFQPNLAKKLEKNAKPKGKKRKFESNTWDGNSEKERNLGILSSIMNKQPKIDLGMALGKAQHAEETARAEEKQQEGREGKKGRKITNKEKRSSYFTEKGGKKGGKKGDKAQAGGKSQGGGKKSFGSKSKGKR